jgi:hypothetical protein
MHTRITQILLVFLLACLACSGSTTATGRINRGAASDLQGDYWFHVSKPLTLSMLKGRVILIDVWQFT